MTDEGEAADSSVDMNVVEAQLKAMKPEEVEEIASRAKAIADHRRDDTHKLGSMSEPEFRDFVRKKFGYSPG